MIAEDFHAEVESGQRFEFGKNWKIFLEKLDEERIHISQSSLSDMLGVVSLHEKTFIDIGSGSGLSSLAARNLGAKVTSFDYDDSSVWSRQKHDQKLINPSTFII